MAGTWALHVTRRLGPLRILLFCWALGAGAATDQMVTPYKAEVRCDDRGYFKYGRCCAMCPPGTMGRNPMKLCHRLCSKGKMCTTSVTHSTCQSGSWRSLCNGTHSWSLLVARMHHKTGKYAAQRCTFDADTVCRQCPGETFTEVWNYVKGCHFCSACDAVMGFEEDTPCSATSNTKCKCKNGTHCEKTPLNECVHCTQHTACSAGTEVAVPGSMHSDTQCAPCPEGYYQSKSSLEANCRQHTDCRSQGLQLVTNGSAVSDSVCAPVIHTVTPAIKGSTGQQESKNTTLLISFGVCILIIVALLMVILIRTPSICKEIGKFFQFEDRKADLERPTHTDPLLKEVPTEPRAPMEDPMPQRRIIAAGQNLEQPCVVMEPEHLQQYPPSGGQRGGPYLQETGPTSPSVGPCPPAAQEVLPEESNTNENLQATKEGTVSSDGIRMSTGANSGVQIQGTKVTYNGNIYIYQVPALPLLPTGGSVPPVQVTLDSNDIPTSVPEQGTPPSMGQVPLPFCQGPAAGWHCIVPQQEEGKDMHLAAEERLMHSMCPVEMDSSLYSVEDSETGFGQYKRGLPEEELY